MAGFSMDGCAGRFVCAAALMGFWQTPPSSAAADEVQELCNAQYVDAYPGSIITCENPQAGLLGQMTMTGPLTATLAVRRIRGLECIGVAVDDVGRIVGHLKVSEAEGAVEGCFTALDGKSCYDFNPINYVGLQCLLLPDAD